MKAKGRHVLGTRDEWLTTIAALEALADQMTAMETRDKVQMQADRIRRGLRLPMRRNQAKTVAKLQASGHMK